MCVFRVLNTHYIVCWYYIPFALIIHLRPGVEIRSGVGPILSVVSVVASGIGRGLVVPSGDWSAGRTGVGREERDLSVGASGIQRGLIGDIYALQSERVIFYPIIPDQAIKLGRHWSGVGRLSGVNVAKPNFWMLNSNIFLLFLIWVKSTLLNGNKNNSSPN